MAQNKNAEKCPLWTRNFIFIIFLNLFVMSIYQIMNQAIPLYVKEGMTGDMSTVGYISGAFTISALIMRPVMGSIADKKGKKFLIIPGILLLGVCCLLCGFTKSRVILVILRISQGIFFSAVSTGASAAVSDIIPKDRVMEGVGYYGLASTMATAVGPGISLHVIEHGGFQADFWLVFGAAVLGAVIAMLISYPGYRRTSENKIPESEKRDSSSYSWLDHIVEKAAIPMSLVMLFAALSQSSISSYLKIYANERSIGNVGLYYTVYAIALFITRPTTGRLSDRFGTNKVIFPGMAMIILAFFLLTRADSLIDLIIVAIVYGLGYGSVQPVLNALMVKYCPADRRGIGNSTFHIAMDGGYGIGAVLWGIVADLFGTTVSIYYGAAVSIGVACILYIILLYKKERKRLKEA